MERAASRDKADLAGRRFFGPWRGGRFGRPPGAHSSPQRAGTKSRLYLTLTSHDQKQADQGRHRRTIGHCTINVNGRLGA